MSTKNSSNRKGKTIQYKYIDVPFDKRYDCFYCGSIATEKDHMPPVSRIYDYKALYDKHIPMLIPSCKECNRLLDDSLQADIYQRVDHLKVLLTKQIGKYIRMGEIWSEEDVVYGDFTGELSKSMEAIPRMAKISRERLDYVHWPVTIDGEVIDRAVDWTQLKMNNKKFNTMDYAYEYARKVHNIPVSYLEHVVDIVGMKNLDYAFKVCKSTPVKTETEMKAVLLELREDFKREE